MIHNFGLAVIFASIALPSLAAARCDQPYAPEIHIAANATKEQIMTLRDDVQTFIAASDVYQACLSKAVQAATVPQRDATRLIALNQKEKERVGNVFNALVGGKSVNAQAGAGNLELVAR